MQIDKEILKSWERLRDFGDIGEIGKISGIGRPTLSRAFNEGQCSEDVFKAINDFYAARQAMIDAGKDKLAS